MSLSGGPKEFKIPLVREVPHPHQTPLTRSRELLNHSLINLIGGVALIGVLLLFSCNVTSNSVWLLVISMSCTS